MPRKQKVIYRQLKDLGFGIVDMKFFGKPGILLKPNPGLPQLAGPEVKENTAFTLEVIEPKSERGKMINTWDELYLFLKSKPSQPSSGN